MSVSSSEVKGREGEGRGGKEGVVAFGGLRICGEGFELAAGYLAWLESGIVHCIDSIASRASA